MPLLPLARQSRPGSEAYSGERLVNYFARPSDGVSPGIILSRGGLTSFADTGSNRVRALTVMGGSLYAVASGKVWKITSGTATQVGVVTDGATDIASSASEIAIVAGGKYYICDGSTTTEYTTGAVTSPVGVEFMDGYFVVIGTSGGRGDALTVSGLDDGTTFDNLDFAFAEESPDALVAILRDHDRLWLFGETTIQTFYNSGAVDFPFSPVAGATMEHGCRSLSPAKAANLVYWVRPDGAVMSSGGVEPQVISTPEIKEALEGATVIRGFTFSERGHEFYAVVRSSGTTLVMDLTTGLWNERARGLQYEPWAAECAQVWNGTTYFGCIFGEVATASQTTYTDFDDVLMGEVVSQPVQQGADGFTVSRLHLEVRGGDVDFGSETPQVMLQTSRDGRTWGREHWRDLATQGTYYKRAVWHGLGYFRRASVRLKITDAVQRDIVGAIYE